MDNKKDNLYYIRKMITDLSFIIIHTQNVTENELVDNEVLLDSILFRLIQISENSSKLTEIFKTQFSQIPWRAIKGMRNRIVHEYGEVDISVVYDTIKDDLPKFLIELEKISTNKNDY